MKPSYEPDPEEGSGLLPIGFWDGFPEAWWDCMIVLAFTGIIVGLLTR